MNLSSDKLLLFYLPREWSRYSRHPHWRAMAQRTNVLAIEPPVGLLTIWRHPGRLADWLRHRGGTLKGEAGLHFMRPMSLLTFGVGHRLPLIARLDRWLLRAQVQRAIDQLRRQHEALVTFVVKVEHAYLADLLLDDLRCYELTDEYLVTPAHPTIDPNDAFTKRAARAQKTILNTVDLVVASSGPLVESRKKQHDHVYYLPNAADYDHFSQTDATPQDVAAIASPRLGFVGALTDLGDITLLNRLATERPNYSLVLVGPLEATKKLTQSKTYRELMARSNVHQLGFRPYETLPGYLHAFDVCLMAFVDNPWNHNCAPNKTYQYLAAGKPIVTTHFPEIETLAEHVRVARSSDEFLRLVDQAVAEEQTDALIAKRKAVAKEYSTDKWASKLLTLIDAALTRKKTF